MTLNSLTIAEARDRLRKREITSAEGIWPAPEGAATLVGYRKLRVSGFLAPETETVLMNTGMGVKYMDVL